ncbi:glycosyltransferase [Micromonospora sp. NPDC050397]|uniref:glycosyltransferase n=1 Tax=Micromonospora sp. NPDC050397 TaxID=3364279 RepID=UPI00384C7E18
MKILFMPYASKSGTWGCVVNMLAIAKEARRRGHEVLFDACPPGARLLTGNGFSVREFEGAVAATTPAAITDIYDVFDTLGLAETSYWDYLMDREVSLIREFGPDAVVVDMRPTASVSASRCGVPLVAMACVGTDPRRQRSGGHMLDDLARRIAGEHSDIQVESFPELLFWTADRKVSPSFARFEPSLQDVPGLGYVGYLEDVGAHGLDGLPPRPERLVLAYLSTVGWNSDLMVRSLAHSAELADVNIWCVTNANGRTTQVSDRLRLFDYLPLDALLPESHGILFHGGQGTALGTLFHGVPSVACPGQHYERRYNANRLQELGCGVHASVMDLRPGRLSKSLHRIVTDPNFGLNASAARADLRSLPGSAGAVDIIESVAR